MGWFLNSTLRNSARAALQSAVSCLLMFVILMIGVVKPAHASGTVFGTFLGFNGTLQYTSLYSDYLCYGSSIAEVQGCELAKVSAHSDTCWVQLNDTGAFYALVDRFTITFKSWSYIWGTNIRVDCGSSRDYYFGVSKICPDYAHASGTTCICNDPTATDPLKYVPDASQTKCIPEQYTIAMQIPPPAEVMPGASKSAYALVTRSDGSAKSGAQVTLTLTVKPELENQLPIAYTGTLAANTESTGSATYAGATDENGKLPFVFKAPEAGGTHTITATCTNCINQATGTIKVPGCPVEPLTEVGDLSNIWDATAEQKQLTQQLESGMDGYSLLSSATRAAEQCLAGRINTVVGSKSGYKVTSTIRTFAYQRHLRNVWDKFLELKGDVEDDATIQQRCQTLISKVEGEMGFRLTQDPTDKDESCNTALGRAHCVRYRPAATDPKHVKNIAFDIPPMTVKKFGMALWLNDLINSTVSQEANACGLTWGGTFGSPDPIHFLSNK